MTKDEFYDELKSDAEMEHRQEYAREKKMRDELDYCIEQHDDLVEALEKAKMNLLIALAKYGHDLSYSELEDWLWYLEIKYYYI